jgi:transcriptional regulator with XRE-family HTH domain
MNKNVAKEKDFYLELGRRIRKARKNLHLTQQELADFLDLNRTSITNIEKGKQKLLAYMLVEFATKLKVTVNELLPENNIKPKEIRIDSLPKNDDSPGNLEFFESVLDQARRG